MHNHVELITIGDELLLGQNLDSNSAFLSRELGNAGFRVTRKMTVGDQESEIASAVGEALSRVPIVICTGGLGPTQDDLTRPAVARLFNAPLEIDQAIVDELLARYARRGIRMPERNLCQAEVPRGAKVLPNPRGTAPGLALFTSDDRVCILLPGVPGEMRGLTMEQVLPLLLQRKRAEAVTNPVRYRTLRTTGIAESMVAEKVSSILPAIAPLTLAFLPHYSGTDLRITSWGELTEEAAASAIARAEAELRAVLDVNIYGVDADDLSAVVGGMLRERKLTLSVAESCTGGLLGRRITDVAGSSDYFVGGVIAYANEVKQRLLGVDAQLLAEHGAVSEPVARAMAAGAQKLHGSNVSLAITGVAGPGGGTAEKPVGTVWLAVAIGDRIESRRVGLPGDREEIRERAAQAALALLWRQLPAAVPAVASR